MTLTEFLLARIAEDEAAGGCGGPDRACDRLSDRWLAECEAKRRILEQCVRQAEYVDTPADAVTTIRLLALPYADHPDFRPEWRP